MPEQLLITKEQFNEIAKIREELDSLVETIEIMNKKDVQASRVHILKSVNDIDNW